MKSRKHSLNPKNGKLDKSIDILLSSIWSHDIAIMCIKDTKDKKQRENFETVIGDINFHKQVNKEYKYVINFLLEL